MNPAIIGKNLRDLRSDKKKTIKEVAGDVKISVSALTMYELGNRVPRDEIKVRLANYYHTTVEAIFFENKCHTR